MQHNVLLCGREGLLWHLQHGADGDLGVQLCVNPSAGPLLGSDSECSTVWLLAVNKVHERSNEPQVGSGWELSAGL